MILDARPRFAAVLCWIIGHEDGPLTYTEQIEGPPGGAPITVVMHDADRRRCSRCGRVVELDPAARPSIGLFTVLRAPEWIHEHGTPDPLTPGDPSWRSDT